MSRKRKLAVALGVGLTGVEAAVVLRRRGTLWGLRTVVRCRRGHLFSTIWIPGASVKALRLGPWRVQRCPVGHHFALVTPVRVADLTPQQLEQARSVKDRLIP